MHGDDTILPDEEEEESVRVRGNSEATSPEVGLSDIEIKGGHEGLAETLLEEFKSIPKEGKTDLDDYVVINVGPSVVPNPYLPTFRVFAYNVTEVEGVEASDAESFMLKKKKKKKDGKDKKKAPKRDHGHKHRKEKEVNCKDKKNRDTWACRPKKPRYAGGESPSRTNRLWTPLGYAQVSQRRTFGVERSGEI